MPYATALPAQNRRALRWRAGKKPWQSLPGTTTTGDVAEILEAHYHIFQMFWQMNSDAISDMVTEAMRVRFESALMGAPGTPAAFAGPGSMIALPESALSKVEERFRQFLDRRELDGKVPGVPTKASLAGVNHRLAHPYAKGNPSRQSFIDTGAYQNNVRVWIKE